MNADLQIPERRVEELAHGISSRVDLKEALLIGVSAVMCQNPDGTDGARFSALLATASASRKAGISHLFMVDSTSDKRVESALLQRGGIVVPVEHNAEGGLARPYVTAARIINMIAPDALMVKAEGEKAIFENNSTQRELLGAAEDFDVITGIRSTDTWASMPPYLRLTESMLALAIRDIAGVPYDTPSGVLALNAAGRAVLITRTVDPAWQYLLSTPFWGKSHGLRVGHAPVEFKYHPEVVTEENNPETDRKRCIQFQLMLDCAVDLAGGALDSRQQQVIKSATMMLSALHQIADML